MFRTPADPASFRRQFARTVLLPIGMLAAVVLVSAVFALYWAASTSNEMSLRRQIETAELALASSADQLAYEQQGFATWQQLSDHLKRSPVDVAWLDAEIGRAMRNLFRHDMTFILDSRGRPLYAYVDGEPAPAASFASVEEDIQPLADAARKAANAVGRSPGAAAPVRPARVTTRTRPGTVFYADATEVGDRPATVNAMVIAPPGADPRGRPLLVGVRFLDHGFLRELAASHKIEGLRFSQQPMPQRGETMVTFKDATGKRIGFFFWKPELPGTRILRVLAPVAAVLILLMFGTMALLARSLWRAGRRLADTVVDLKASEAQAQHLAFHDVLTGLPNRALFQDRLEQALGRARRGQPCAVLALDLDRFKQVNDTLGHSAGDALIRAFAGRLSAVVRASDTVARIGGDEFSVVMCDASRREDVEQLCERILETVREPFDLLGSRVFVGVSIGVAVAPEAGTDRGELIRKADIALYLAKSGGRDRYQMFEPEMDETVKLRREIENDLRRAIAGEGELQLLFQPQVDSSGGSIQGLEALLRWHHPTRGLLAPEAFISIAEETGLIKPLGEWVLGEACRVARDWPDLFVAVNLSAVQLRSPDLARRVVAIAEAAGCEPRQIELEITETVLLDADKLTRDTLAALREAGFRIALDDFGTGYSSLNYLRQFKVDKIKIDRSFTRNLAQDQEAAAIVTSVVTLGHAMGLTVTAEGVENRDQMQLLSAAGCNELQGYLFARPVPEQAIGDLIAARKHLSEVA